MINKRLFSLAGALLIAIAGGETIAASSYGNLEFDKRLALVAENNQEVLLLSMPSAKQMQEFVRKILPHNPGRYGYRRVYSPELIRVNRQGKQTKMPIRRQAVVYQDGISHESLTLDLLAFETKQGRRWVAEPGTDTPDLLPNPSNPSQMLFIGRGRLRSPLNILDAKTLKVKQVNVAGLQKAIAQIQALRPDEELGPRLTWVSQPTWSLDGKFIAFISNRNNYQNSAVWLHNVATGQDSQVIEIPGVVFHLHGWTTDGRILARSIVVSKEVNSSKETVVAINPATKQIQQLAEGSLLTVSDDGKTLLYATRKNEPPFSQTVYALSLKTGKSQLVFQDSPQENFGSRIIDFSANGDRIAFALANSGKRRQSLFVYNLPTQQAKRFPLPQTHLGFPVVWAGDHLLVPLEDLQKLKSQTLLLSVDSSSK